MKKFLQKKRNLSESSDDPDEPGAFHPAPSDFGSSESAGGFNPLLGEGLGAQTGAEQFYSADSRYSEVQAFKRPRIEPEGRRPSQASTTSSVSGAEEDGALDRDAASLSRALESTSSSDTEEDVQAHNSRISSNGAAAKQKAPTYSKPPAAFSHRGEKPKVGGPGRGAAAAPGTPAGGYSSQAERMMSMMGYKSGTGLGKAQQGRVEPVSLSTQRGRRGLGHIIEGLESNEELEWTPEEVTVKEKVSWMRSNQQPAPTFEELRDWVRTGARNTDISGETTFCEPQVLQNVLSCKNVFDKLESFEMMKARSRSNPFETIAKGIFQNRAAMKMANMDTVFDFMFTDPRGEDGKSLVQDGEPLYFGDVCAGPGGFSEYVLWKKKWRAKGYGFTLKDGKHDFKLEDFFAGPPEGFEPYYGVDGVKGDGNVFRSENIKELRRFVLENTNNRGVHFMMADGGFSVEGSENIQEILSKQLYLCQCIVALGIVRTKGHFLCKLFDLFTPFSVGLLYLMYRCFEKVCIHKPNTSRPANSERYIVCKWKRPDTDNIYQYLLQINVILNDLDFNLLGRTKSDTDVLEIVPMELLSQDADFFNYIVNSNNEIGENQVTGLEKIAAFYKNRNLYEKRQAEVRRECLEFWRVPDQGRMRPRYEEPQYAASRLVSSVNIFRETESIMRSPQDLDKHFKSVYDWRFVVTGTVLDNDSQEIRTFLVSTGRQRVYYLPQGGTSNWRPISGISSCTLELPAETLLYVELVWEMKGESKAQKKVMSVHVIDALYLAGEDVRHHHFMERNKLVSQFVKVMNKPSRSDLVRLRIKSVFKLEDLAAVWEKLERRALKGKGEADVLFNPEADPDGSYKFFQAKGLLFYKHVKDPFIMAWSKSSKRKYYFNTRTRKPVENYCTPAESIAEFEACHSTRAVWYWNSSHEDEKSGLTKEEVVNYVFDKLNPR